MTDEQIKIDDCFCTHAHVVNNMFSLCWMIKDIKNINKNAFPEISDKDLRSLLLMLCNISEAIKNDENLKAIRNWEKIL